jgi:hypothetical protein
MANRVRWNDPAVSTKSELAEFASVFSERAVMSYPARKETAVANRDRDRRMHWAFRRVMPSLTANPRAIAFD